MGPQLGIKNPHSFQPGGGDLRLASFTRFGSAFPLPASFEPGATFGKGRQRPFQFLKVRFAILGKDFT